MKTEIIEKATLYFQQGSSDKIYKASLEQQGEEAYIVNFAYGRRGATLKTGTKTQSPVGYEKAKKIFDKLVNSKASKGYVPKENDDVQYVHDYEQRRTGIHCQLLNPIEEEALTAFFENDDWWIQEKKDGKRMLIKKEANEVVFINRKGLSVGGPAILAKQVAEIQHDFIIDGEAIGEAFYVFDLLHFDQSLKDKSYEERYAILCKHAFFNENAIQLVSTAKSKTEKEQLFENMKAASAEGIVIKDKNAIFTPGRPNSGGTQLKFKFYETASVFVTKVNDKRSVAVGVLDGKKTVAVGNVTIAVNKEIPKAGSIIEVRYLYAYKGGSLYQPTYLHERTDLDKTDCVIEQLKYKQELPQANNKTGAELYQDIFDNPDKYNKLICRKVWYFEEDKIDKLEPLHFSKTCESMISNLSGYWYDFYDGDEISDVNKDFLGLAEYYSAEDEQHIFAVDTSDPKYPVHRFNHETGFERVSKSLKKFIADCINPNTSSK